jgi:hypothetical protein
MKLALCALVSGVVMFTALTGHAEDSFLDKLKSATEKLQQLQGQQSQTPPAQQPAPQRSTSQTTATSSEAQKAASQSASAADSATPEATAKLAASVGSYDVVGIKLGMSGKEAAAALRAHGHGLHVTPETLKYDVLPGPLMYGVYAASPELLRGGAPIQPNTEKIYLMLTMPPNQQVVSRISRYVIFSKETAPTQQILAAELEKKYGPVSYDSAPGDLFVAGARTMIWVDDAQGSRLKGVDFKANPLHSCMRHATTWGEDGSFQATSVEAREIKADENAVKSRLEQGYDNRSDAQSCPDYTIIHAKLFRALELGLKSPDVVGVLLVTIGSKPLDRSATNATHDLLVQAVKARKAQEKEAAEKNKPAL